MAARQSTSRWRRRGDRVRGRNSTRESPAGRGGPSAPGCNRPARRRRQRRRQSASGSRPYRRSVMYTGSGDYRDNTPRDPLPPRAGVSTTMPVMAASAVPSIGSRRGPRCANGCHPCGVDSARGVVAAPRTGNMWENAEADDSPPVTGRGSTTGPCRGCARPPLLPTERGWRGSTGTSGRFGPGASRAKTAGRQRAAPRVVVTCRPAGVVDCGRRRGPPRGWLVERVRRCGLRRLDVDASCHPVGPISLAILGVFLVVERVRPAQRRPLIARGHRQDLLFTVFNATLVVPLVAALSLSFSEIARTTPPVDRPAEEPASCHVGPQLR